MYLFMMEIWVQESADTSKCWHRGRYFKLKQWTISLISDIYQHTWDDSAGLVVW